MLRMVIAVLMSALTAAAIGAGLLFFMINMIHAYRLGEYRAALYYLIGYGIFCAFLYHIPLPGDTSNVRKSEKEMGESPEKR
jgi:hypothetical protein